MREGERIARNTSRERERERERREREREREREGIEREREREREGRERRTQTWATQGSYSCAPLEGKLATIIIKRARNECYEAAGRTAMFQKKTLSQGPERTKGLRGRRQANQSIACAGVKTTLLMDCNLRPGVCMPARAQSGAK